MAVVVTKLQVILPEVLSLSRKILAHKKATFNPKAFTKFIRKTGERMETRFLVALSLYALRTKDSETLPQNFSPVELIMT